MEEPTIRYEVADRVATVTLDRPTKLNAISAAMWSELLEALRRAEGDDGVRVVILTGAGRCFSVGGDIEGFRTLDDAGARRSFIDGVLATYRTVEEFPKPTIAAVHGYALGGGCELAMVCDLVVADETSQFGTPEADLGLMPGVAVARGGTQLNAHWLKYMVFTGERLDAAKAERIGLVNEVVAAGEHLAAARRLAAAVASKAPLALRVAKRMLNRHGGDVGYDHSTEAVAFLYGTADHAEAAEAFGEERTPIFRGL